jgi:predicted RND superfamily exporter protein
VIRRITIDQLVERLTLLSYRRCWWFLGAAVVLVAGAVVLAARLELRSSFVELLPSNFSSVRNLKELIAHVGGDGTVLVSVEALDGPQDLAKAEAWTSRLAKEFRALGPDSVRSVLDNFNDTESWYADHWPVFAPLEELQGSYRSLSEELHRRKAAANPFLFEADDSTSPKTPLPADIAPWLDGRKPLPREQVRERFTRYLDGYMVHPDRRSVAILIRPTGTSLSVTDAKSLLQRMQQVVDRHRAELQHDRIRVGFAGSFPLLVASYEAILRGIASTALLVVVLEVLVLLIYLRQVRFVLALMFAVLVAVLVDFGLTRLVIGYLNTQTGFLGAIVVGNGINYGLIYLGRTRQQRAAGVGLQEALADGAVTSARATLLAALASSVSFGVLGIASNRGFRHFAFIGGVGMFLCWAATFLLVPAFFGAAETFWPIHRGFVRRRERVLPEKRPHPRLARVFAHPRWIVLAVAALCVSSVILFIAAMPRVMETNLKHLDNRLTSTQAKELLRDNDRANAALGSSAEGAVALLPSPVLADAFCATIRERKKLPVNAALIDDCLTLTSVVPRDQSKRLAIIEQIAGLLTDAVVESLPADQQARVSEVREQLTSQHPLAIEKAPPAPVDRFREADGTLGRVAVISSRPEARLEEGPRLIAFGQAVRGVHLGEGTYDAAGEQIVVADLWADIFREGPRTTLLSFSGVCLLVLLFFREWRRRFEVLAALSSGALLMAGAGTVLGFKINFFNFIVFPVTFGIAVDYGANVSARIRDRRGQVFGALAEVGPAVAVCCLTSVVGYFSLLFSVNQALQSFGRYAMAGEVTSIATALVLVPALALSRFFPSRKGAHESEGLLPLQAQKGEVLAASAFEVEEPSPGRGSRDLRG